MDSTTLLILASQYAQWLLIVLQKRICTQTQKAFYKPRLQNCTRLHPTHIHIDSSQLLFIQFTFSANVAMLWPARGSDLANHHAIIPHGMHGLPLGEVLTRSGP